MDKELVVIDNLDIVSYSAAINEIVSKFYDEDGNYTPHFGRINSVGVFFNYFVNPTSLEAYFADYEKPAEIDDLIADEYCMKVYNGALKRTMDYRLNFANAYIDAMDIVKTRNSAIGGLVDLLGKEMEKIADKIAPIFNEKTIDKIVKISDNVSKGKLSADSIVEAVGKTIK